MKVDFVRTGSIRLRQMKSMVLMLFTLEPQTKEINMKRPLQFLLLISFVSLAAVFLTINYVQNESPAPSLPPSSNPSEGIAQASWPIRYATIAEITKDADLIVVASVNSIVGTKEVGPELITTQFELTVDDVIKGSSPSGSKIIIQQTGGTVGEKSIRVSDDPLLQNDIKYILFLREFEPQKYVIVGGPQGRFIVQNGKVYSMIVVVSPKDKAGLGVIAGMDFSKFITAIKSAGK